MGQVEGERPIPQTTLIGLEMKRSPSPVSSIHALTRPAATLSHPMGEGQVRIFTFPASLEIPAMGLAGRAAEK
jgi:hypothetical protein